MDEIYQTIVTAPTAMKIGRRRIAPSSRVAAPSRKASAPVGSPALHVGSPYFKSVTNAAAAKPPAKVVGKPKK